MPPAKVGAEGARGVCVLRDVGARERERDRVCRVRDAPGFDQAGHDSPHGSVGQSAARPARVALVDRLRVLAKAQRRRHRASRFRGVRGLHLVPRGLSEASAEVLENLAGGGLELGRGVEDEVEGGDAGHHWAAVVLFFL